MAFGFALVRCKDAAGKDVDYPNLLIGLGSSYLAQAVLPGTHRQTIERGMLLNEARDCDHQTVQARRC
jgi:hypothetical protein